MTPDSSPYPEPPPRAIDAETEARLYAEYQAKHAAFMRAYEDAQAALSAWMRVFVKGST